MPSGRHTKQKPQKGRKKGRQRIQGQKRKGTSGNAANFITRQQAIKKLQLSLPEFRKLCILHGIYPREPRHSPKGKDKTYFYVKDIMYLIHDPLVSQFRDYHAWKYKITRARHKKEAIRLETLKKNKPKYRLDHVVLRRYPTFDAALDDLDDALSMIYLFGCLQQNHRGRAARIENCLQLAKEWESIVAVSHYLRKVFVSIKGIYYQAHVNGHEVTWMIPHQFTYPIPDDVDIRVMGTFLEFYESLMSFVLFKLYHDEEVPYPQAMLPLKNTNPCPLRFQSAPTATIEPLEDDAAEQPKALIKEQSNQQLKTKSRIKSLSSKMDSIIEGEENEKDESEDEVEEGAEDDEMKDEEDEEQVHPLASLFANCKIFLSREVPLYSLEFCVKSCGGEASWASEEAHTPPFPEDEITHQVVDRPSQNHVHLSRNYVQPQWVYDSINAGILLPVEEYAPGKELPPHLSPFVNDEQEGYIPDQRKHLDELVARAKNIDELQGEITGEEDEKMEVPKVDREKTFQAELEKESRGVYAGEEEDDEDEEDDEEEEKKRKRVVKAAVVDEKEEENQLASIMIPGRKKKRLYTRIQYSVNDKKQKIEHLESKKQLHKQKKAGQAK